MGTELTRFSGSDAREDRPKQPRRCIAALWRFGRNWKVTVGQIAVTGNV